MDQQFQRDESVISRCTQFVVKETAIRLQMYELHRTMRVSAIGCWWTLCVSTYTNREAVEQVSFKAISVSARCLYQNVLIITVCATAECRIEFELRILLCIILFAKLISNIQGSASVVNLIFALFVDTNQHF
jgi:hypothetical protein